MPGFDPVCDSGLVNSEYEMISQRCRLKCCLRGGGVETARGSLSCQGC